MWALTSLLWVSLTTIPDSSPRACRGVEYFFGREDSEGLGLLFVACPGGMDVPFCRDRSSWGHVTVGFRRSVVVLRPCIRSPCESNFPRAPTHSRCLVKGRLVFVIVIPQAFFNKMEGLSSAMFFLYGRNMVLGELLMG